MLLYISNVKFIYIYIYIYIYIFFIAEIVEGVRNGSDTYLQPLRPLVIENTCDDEVSSLMKRCWAEEAADRPDFTALKNNIRKLNK